MANIKSYGLESYFNENVIFFKDVTIHGTLSFSEPEIESLYVSNGLRVGQVGGATTALVVEGSSTLGTVKVTSGIVTATSGIVTYYGDGSNLQVNGTSLSSAISAAVPTGVILMWSGSIATIPTGWALCDGSNNTPDLRNRFIVGATSDISTGVTFNADTGVVSGAYAPGNTGGSVAHQLTIAEMPAHTHSGGAQWPGSGPEQDQAGGPENRTTFNINTGSTGGTDFHENRPPYYALAYIMKT